MGKLDGRIAVVTGGARGLGAAAARRLAAEGAQVGVFDLREADETRDQIRSAGGVCEGWRCDTTDEAQVAAAFEGVRGRFGSLDILVNNAGILQGRSVSLELSKAEVEKYIEINYVGYFVVTKAAYPLLKQSEHGRIINVASRTYFLANPGQMAYVASKGAVLGMTRVLARELGPDNICVNAVMPGQVATEGTRQYNEEEAFNRTMQNQSIKKRGTPEHLAGLIAFLASDDAELITGQTILCDGGAYLH
jgi:NAD(P)-dependent dehydrogenase (short-subunit alcohol dehydrogenase family)